jgi:hypothetical protein
MLHQMSMRMDIGLTRQNVGHGYYGSVTQSLVRIIDNHGTLNVLSRVVEGAGGVDLNLMWPMSAFSNRPDKV